MLKSENRNFMTIQVLPRLRRFADAAKFNILFSHGIPTALSLLPSQPASHNKSIFNEAVSNVFRNKAIGEKGQASLVVFGLAENNNDKLT